MLNTSFRPTLLYTPAYKNKKSLERLLPKHQWISLFVIPYITYSSGAIVFSKIDDYQKDKNILVSHKLDHPANPVTPMTLPDEHLAPAFMYTFFQVLENSEIGTSVNSRSRL